MRYVPVKERLLASIRIDPETEPGVLSSADAAVYRPLWIERVARTVRVPWQTITLRRRRQRWRRGRDE